MSQLRESDRVYREGKWLRFDGTKLVEADPPADVEEIYKAAARLEFFSESSGRTIVGAGTIEATRVLRERLPAAYLIRPGTQSPRIPYATAWAKPVEAWAETAKIGEEAVLVLRERLPVQDWPRVRAVATARFKHLAPEHDALGIRFRRMAIAMHEAGDFIVREQNQVVGRLTYEVEPKRKLVRVRGLRVDRDRRRLGVGSALITALLERFPDLELDFDDQPPIEDGDEEARRSFVVRVHELIHLQAGKRAA